MRSRDKTNVHHAPQAGVPGHITPEAQIQGCEFSVETMTAFRLPHTPGWKMTLSLADLCLTDFWVV